VTSDVCVFMQGGAFMRFCERCSSNVSYDARAFIWSESVFRSRSAARVLSRLDLVSNLVISHVL